MRFKKTLLALAVLALGLTVFVVTNDKTSTPVTPVMTVKYKVAPTATDAFVDSVRLYAEANEMRLTQSVDSPDNLILLLRSRNLHVNIARYGADAAVSAGFFKSSAWFGMGEDQIREKAGDFTAIVSRTSGVTVVP